MCQVASSKLADCTQNHTVKLIKICSLYATTKKVCSSPTTVALSVIQSDNVIQQCPYCIARASSVSVN